MAALEYGFYDSYEYDRLYNAEQMNSIFEGVITDGVYAGVGNHFAVHPGTGLQVVVDTGRAWFKMTWNKNRTLTPLYLDMPDPVYSRIDTICIRVRKNLEHRMNDFYVYRGNVTANPTPPTLNDTSDTFYLPLANVTVRPNAESISTSDIEMLVGKTRCPFVTSILQQTDITDLFKQWEGQFVEWWESVRHILDLVEGGNLGEIFLEIDKKVDRADKATSQDVTLNSDSKWMTPLRTKEMIDSSVGDIGEMLKSGVVMSFKGRTGAVTPASGDYTAAQVGALSLKEGGTVDGYTRFTDGITVGDTSNETEYGFTSWQSTNFYGAYNSFYGGICVSRAGRTSGAIGDMNLIQIGDPNFSNTKGTRIYNTGDNINQLRIITHESQKSSVNASFFVDEMSPFFLYITDESISVPSVGVESSSNVIYPRTPSGSTESYRFLLAIADLCNSDNIHYYQTIIVPYIYGKNSNFLASNTGIDMSIIVQGTGGGGIQIKVRRTTTISIKECRVYLYGIQ